MTHEESEAPFGCWMQAKMAEHATALKLSYFSIAVDNGPVIKCGFY